MTMLSVPYALGQLGVSGSPDAFRAVGFNISPNGLLAVLNGAIAFSGVGQEHQFLGIGAVGPMIPTGVTLDGISVLNSEVVPPVDHPNGVYELDHIVVLTPDIDRTSHHTQAVLGLRQLGSREADGQRQIFHRFADVAHPGGDVSKGCLVELVQTNRVTSARLWGVVFNTYDLAAMAQRCGGLLGEPHEAVQPERQIAVFAPGAALGIQVAVMTPVVPKKDRQ